MTPSQRALNRKYGAQRARAREKRMKAVREAKNVSRDTQNEEEKKDSA